MAIHHELCLFDHIVIFIFILVRPARDGTGDYSSTWIDALGYSSTPMDALGSYPQTKVDSTGSVSGWNSPKSLSLHLYHT